MRSTNRKAANQRRGYGGITRQPTTQRFGENSQLDRGSGQGVVSGDRAALALYQDKDRCCIAPLILAGEGMQVVIE